jgi:hypothetical protein
MTYRISWNGPPSTLAPEQLVPLSIKVEIQEACGIERHYSYVYVLGNSQPTAATLLNTVNSAGVTHGHATAPSLRITRAYRITTITTYHYGAMPSQGTIALRGSDGRMYGTWRVQPVQGGWFAVYPNVIVPAGTYAVVDSDPKSWSHNAGSNNVGMTMIEGIAQ